MNKWKRAVFRLFENEPVEVVALEEPPVSDTDAGLVCPDCGRMEANVREVYDREMGGNEPIQVALCPCGCEFTPMMESQAKRVVQEVFEQRRRRMKARMHREATYSPEYAAKKEAFRLVGA